MKRYLLLLLVFVVGVALLPVPAAGDPRHGTGMVGWRGLDPDDDGDEDDDGDDDDGDNGHIRGLRLVGSHNIGGRGFNGDVWIHRKVAYIGAWGGPVCPGRGVAAIDVARPGRPRLLSEFAASEGTSAEDVVVPCTSSR
jgi:hypothetical protein